MFDASKIATLVNKYSGADIYQKGYSGADDNSIHRRPTCFEAISAFIWGRFSVASSTRRPKQESKGQVYKYRLLANIRTRTEPQLPDNYFGNISVDSIAPLPLSSETADDNCSIVPSTIKDAIKQMDPEYVKRLQQQSGWYMDFLTQHYTQSPHNTTRKAVMGS